MNTSLDHLPEAKRRELELVVQVVRDGFADAIKHRTQDRFRDGKLLKIILFGSHARGDWVDDPVGRYFSDFDILLVVSHDDLTDVPEFWVKTEDHILELLTEGKALRTPVSLIYHSLDDLNEKLRLGRYFFIDILNDGIELYSAEGTSFAEPTTLSPQEALDETQAFYSEWMENAEQTMEAVTFHMKKGHLKLAAFNLHQTAERLYQCLFLVRTLYTPKTHNLNRLRTLAEDMEPALKEVWPAKRKEQRQAYSRLREAYIKARYSREYRVTVDQLQWLSLRIGLLFDCIRLACEARIEDLQKAA